MPHDSAAPRRSSTLAEQPVPETISLHRGGGRQRVGLLAGWGRFPLMVAQALVRQGHEVYGLGIKNHADPQLAELCANYREIGVAKVGGAIRHFNRHQVQLATMAGKIHKVLMFQRFAWLKHLPDWTCIKTFYPHFISKTKDRTDDSMLYAVVDAYAKRGITFAPATDFAPELLVKQGTLAGRAPSRGEWLDIAFGWRLAKEMGRLDVGQSVAVKGQAVIAVEAIEGTDQCIQRAGELCPSGGFTVVKVAKPQQDMRFDVPTIGAGTLESLAKAGARLLAVEADKTIVIDQAELAQLARRHSITVVAIHDAMAELKAA